MYIFTNKRAASEEQPRGRSAPVTGADEHDCCFSVEVSEAGSAAPGHLCVLWYLRVRIQPYYPGMNYGVDAGMQAAPANKLPRASISPRHARRASFNERKDYLPRTSSTRYLCCLAAGNQNWAEGSRVTGQTTKTAS